jgi:hypothetical protein
LGRDRHLGHRLRRRSLWRRLGTALAASSSQAHAAHAFQCPHAQEGAASASLTAADPEILKSEDRVDLATEINDVVDQLQLQQPGLSYAQVVNALVAAYCPIVVELPNLTDAQKHARVTRFSALARQLTPANSLPSGSLVIATVPLSLESTVGSALRGAR